jgi:hypothetical protein
MWGWLMRGIRSIAALSLLAAQWNTPALYAQSVTEADLLGRFDLAVPDVPAASVLGMSPDTVIRPSSGKDFAASLLNGVGMDGKLQAGLAFDVRPALYLAQDSFTLSKYRDVTEVLGEGTVFERYKMRPNAYWTKLRASFATGRSESGTSEANRYAIGLNWNIFDHGDSRLSPAYRGCVKPVLDDINEQLADVEANAELDEQVRRAEVARLAGSLESAGAKRVQACAEDFEASHWNADSWDFGAAYLSFDTAAVKSEGYAAWTTYARHLGSKGQLILHARYQDNEVAPDPQDQTALVVQDTNILGTRLRWKAPGGTFLLEATHRDIDRRTGEDDRYTLASVGYEFRIAPGLWLQLAFGKAYGTDAFESDDTFSGQFRWGYTEKSILER